MVCFSLPEAVCFVIVFGLCFSLMYFTLVSVATLSIRISYSIKVVTIAKI